MVTKIARHVTDFSLLDDKVLCNCNDVAPLPKPSLVGPVIQLLAPRAAVLWLKVSAALAGPAFLLQYELDLVPRALSTLVRLPEISLRLFRFAGLKFGWAGHGIVSGMDRLSELSLDADCLLQLRNRSSGELFEKYQIQRTEILREMGTIRKLVGLDLFGGEGTEGHE